MANPTDWGAVPVEEKKPAAGGPAAWGAVEATAGAKVEGSGTRVTPQTQSDVDAAMVSPPDLSAYKPRAEDVMTRAASSLSFGTAEKMSALIDSQLGKGSYDELLKKRREETAQAGDRLGPVGAFLADVAGGALTGAALGRVGLTLLGRLPATAPLPMKILAGSAEGGLYGAASGAGHTDTGKAEDYYQNMKVGGLLGAATGGIVTGAASALPRLVTPFPTTDPVRAKAMQTLADAGVDVSAGTKTGSPKLRMAEDVVSKVPLGGDTTAGAQMAQVTQAVMKKAGIGGGGAATPDVVEAGFNTVGGKIGSLQRPYTLDVDGPLLNAAAKVEAETKPLVAEGFQKPLQHFIDKITGQQQLTPELAQATRTQLNTAIKEATDPAYRRGLLELKSALDETLERAMQKAGDHAGVAELQLARNQYAHLHILADALGASGAAGMRGELTPSALATAVSRSVGGKKDFFRGEGDLNDLARASAGYLQPPRDSGTATREGYQNPAKWLLGAAGRIGINNRFAQGYLGNQALPVAPSGAQLQPPVAGLVGPADKIIQGLLMGGR